MGAAAGLGAVAGFAPLAGLALAVMPPIKVMRAGSQLPAASSVRAMGE